MKIFLFFLIFFLFCTNCSIIKRAINQDEGNENYMSTSDLELYNYSFTEATKQKIFSNYNQAINLFFKCVEINPKSAAAYYQLSDIYLNNGDKERALNFARIASGLNNRNIWYKLQLARIYQLVGKKDSTIFIYKKIVKSNPKKYEYQFNLSLLYVEVGEYRKAINILKVLEDSNGLTEEIALALFQIYSNLKENRNCVRILKEAIKKYPEETKFYGLLAEHYASNGDFDLALKYYQELLSLNPENEKGLLSIIEFYRVNGKFEESFVCARNFIKNENFKLQDKIEILVGFLNDSKLFDGYKDQVKELIEFLLKNYNDDAKVHTLNADFNIKTNSLINAKDELLFVTQKLDNNYVLWEQLFYVLSSLSDYELIYSLSEQTIVKFNDKPIIYLFRGISAYQLKKYKEAISVLLKGLSFIRNSTELNLQFFTFLGESYNSLGDFDNSDAYFNMALSIDPTNLYLLNNYSYYLAIRNMKIDFALTNIQKCIDIEPNNINYLETYGYVLFRKGRFVEAKIAFEKAIDLGGIKNSNAIEHYLEILCKLNMKDLVEKYYKIFLELGNNNDYINELVKPALN
jgi:tetratricopeptide (TPR) repeat protein